MADVENRFTSVAATGTNEATAAAIPRTGIWTVALVTGNTPAGVVLPSSPYVGDLVEIHGAENCYTYPASGFTINGASGGQSLDTNTLLRCISSSQWVNVQD